LPGESDITVVTVIGNQLTTAVELYSNPANRDALRIKVADGIANLLASAKAESDHQLQFARIFGGLAVTEGHGKQLRALLDGKLAGLKVDADLRWTFVLALCERGLFTRAELDAELERDNTINGQLGHATCVAAFPTAESKAAAWKAIMDERRYELCFEGHRYVDVKRLGGKANASITRDATDDIITNDLTIPYNDYRFTLPIPQSELNANGVIRSQQNPGY
jgi:hypothetical protein